MIHLYYFSTGGSWLITNMHRDKSIFEIDPSVHDEIAEGIKTEGSNLCGISACCSWEHENNNSMQNILLIFFYLFDFYF